MTDIVSPKKRSEMMSGIRDKNTKPEIMIRSALHRRGFRYRLHVKSLPGKPDLVFPKYNALLLINGCFWHGHNCHLFKWPKTGVEFWREKIEKNISRDKAFWKKYRKSGWRIAIIWECALKGKKRMDQERLINNVTHFLNSKDPLLELSGGKPDAPKN